MFIWEANHRKTCLPHFTLAHVCRTLRKEFLPFLVARTEFRISLHQVHIFIGCWILPPNIEVEQAVGRVVVERSWVGHQIFDVKPLLLLLEAAKDTSIVFKHVIIKGYGRKDARDYTLQELLEALLGVDYSSFSGYAREADSMKLSLCWCEVQHGADIDIWVVVGLPELYWKPWMTQWGLQLRLYKSLNPMTTMTENRGIGMGPSTAHWDPIPDAMFLQQDHWMKRLTSPVRSRGAEGK